MKTTKEKIEVMQAWEDGRPIQAHDGINPWFDLVPGEPGWCWEGLDYRIKPESEALQSVRDFLKYLDTSGFVIASEGTAWRLGASLIEELLKNWEAQR